MSRLYIIIVFLSIFIPSFSAVQLSDSAKISLLTCAPGQELYSLYGHSALRVNDDINSLDLVFNYGTFNFNTPNFYLKFANGNLKYMLSVSRFNSFLNNYLREERSVWEQELNLSSIEKQRLFDALAINSAPENKYYRYDFFFDNCASRIRDIVYNNLDGHVSYADTSQISRPFRDFIHEYEDGMPWIKDGLDIILGSKTDNQAYVNEQMFLPDYLMHYFGKAVIKSENKKDRRLVKQTTTLLKFEPQEKFPSIIGPDLLFWTILMLSIALLFYELRVKQQPVMLLNRLLFAIVGVLGLLIVFLWFFTRHGVTGNNFNLLWTHPLYLIPALLPLKYLKKNWCKPLLIITIAGLLLMLLSCFFIPQYIPAMVFPLVLLLLSRFFYLYLFINKL